jgi:creatinine amidohydrolase/Fe(II)-dependent formamide hydrolase-like protein
MTRASSSRLRARLIQLAELTAPEAAKLARSPKVVVILPLGAIEQHGPHLPLLVDWRGAEELAYGIAPHLARAGWRPVLAPPIPYGVSTLAVGWPGTVSLTVATLRRLVVEVVSGLASHGFRRVVLTNYQADPDHLRAIDAARRELTRRRRVQVLVAGFEPGAKAAAPMTSPRVRALLRSPRPEAEWHSGELETAFMLAVDRRLVRTRIARRLPPAWFDFRGALARGARNFRRLGPGGDGYFGWPAAARARTGRAALALRGKLIAAELVQALGKRARS